MHSNLAAKLTTPNTTFEAGAYIFRESDPGDCAYIIESGEVEILFDRDGQEVAIATLGQGEILGELALIDGLPRSGSARALKPTAVTEIPLDYFRLKLEQSDPTIRMFMRLVMNRYRDLNTRLGRVASSLSDVENDGEFEDLSSSTMLFKNLTSQYHELQNRIDSAVKQPADANSAAAFSEETLEFTRVMLTEEKFLRKAIENEEFVLYYQPVIELAQKKIVGCEALIRWNHPTGELVLPSRFMQHVEQSDLIIKLGYWIAEQACKFQKRVEERFNYDFFVAINLSGKQFEDQTLVPELARIISNTGATRSKIVFEVTESLLIDNPEVAAQALHDLKETGASLAIDDFGTGYSSFSYLHRLPFDKLKIDRAFVSAMGRNRKSENIVKSLINLGRDLEMTVVAEGIETRAESRKLRDLKATYGQGFYYSRPLSEADFMQFIHPRKDRRTKRPR